MNALRGDMQASEVMNGPRCYWLLQLLLAVVRLLLLQLLLAVVRLLLLVSLLVWLSLLMIAVAGIVACGKWCSCGSSTICPVFCIRLLALSTEVPTGQPEPDTECPTVLGLLGLAYLTANAICNMASGPMLRKTTLRGTRFQGISVGRTIAEAQAQ